MNTHTQNGFEWLTFPLLQDCPKLSHGSFLRHGLDTNWKAGIDELNLEHPRWAQQVHKTSVKEVSAATSKETPSTDGFMTDHTNVSLIIKHADCQAAIFYDPIHHSIANVHAGWRGMVQNIYQTTIDQMKARYGTDPRELLVAISPSLGPDAAEFRNYREELPQSFWDFQIRPKYFDLWQIARWQLIDCGVLSHHIEIASQCTYSNPESFFSYRRDKNTSRLATFVTLK